MASGHRGETSATLGEFTLDAYCKQMTLLYEYTWVRFVNIINVQIVVFGSVFRWIDSCVLCAADARHAEDVQPGAREPDDHNAGARAREAPVRQPHPSRPVHPQVSANGLFCSPSMSLQFSVLFLSDV